MNSSSSVSVILGEATPALIAAKIIGALAGSLISIAYILPRGRREAALRLSVGLVTGLIFGGTVGVKAADMLGLLGKVSAMEVTMTGATLASLCAWWGLGVLQRVSERLPTKQHFPMKNSTDKKDTHS